MRSRCWEMKEWLVVGKKEVISYDPYGPLDHAASNYHLIPSFHSNKYKEYTATSYLNYHPPTIIVTSTILRSNNLSLLNASKMHHLEEAVHNVERAIHNLETAIDNLEAAKHNSSAQPFSSPPPRPSPSYTHSSTQTTPPPPQETPPTRLLEKVKQLNAICDTYSPILESAIWVIFFGMAALVVVESAVGLVGIVLYLLFLGVKAVFF